MIISALLTEIKIKLLQHYLLYIFFNSIQFNSIYYTNESGNICVGYWKVLTRV
jgi:hypothetical protein